MPASPVPIPCNHPACYIGRFLKRLATVRLYSRGLQLVVGEPMYPSGQVQMARWLTARQCADGAQGCSAQGFMHRLIGCIAWFESRECEGLGDELSGFEK